MSAETISQCCAACGTEYYVTLGITAREGVSTLGRERVDPRRERAG